MTVGGQVTTGQFDDVFLWIGRGEIYEVPVPVIIMLIVSAVMIVFLGRTRWGRTMYAIGGNREAARLAGMRVVIGYAVLGANKPNAFGTVVGALFVGIMISGLTMHNVPYYTQDFVKGLVLVAALVMSFSSVFRRGGPRAT
jgi:simple sugar transport system permease protein